MDEFDDILRQATEQIGEDYFQLPIAGQDDAIYRERVYCYELYHLLRTGWPIDSPFRLSGEIDKSGHPLVREEPLTRVKPDLLVHIPGQRTNAVAIEVKSVPLNTRGLTKDLETLSGFMELANYENAALLVYGPGGRARVAGLLAAAIDQAEHIVVPDQIRLWVHEQPGVEAQYVGTVADA